MYIVYILMRLNVQTDYALRLLMYLSVNTQRLCTIREIAAHYHVSRNHLVKVAHGLSRGAFVTSVRGRGGGLQLASVPDAISIGAVVRAIENDFQLVECGAPSSSCMIYDGCKLRGVLGEAMSAFLAVLDQYTLHDLTRRNAPLRTLLLREAS